MTQRIIYTNENGGVSVVVPAPNYKGTMQELQSQLEARGNLVTTGTPEIVSVDDIPADRTFRNAWEHDTTASPNKIGLKLDKAVGISLERVREKRDAALLELDKQYTIAQRQGVTDTSAIDAKRQALLDATNALKALDTNHDGFLSAEEVAGKLLPLEVFEV